MVRLDQRGIPRPLLVGLEVYCEGAWYLMEKAESDQIAEVIVAVYRWAMIMVGVDAETIRQVEEVIDNLGTTLFAPEIDA